MRLFGGVGAALALRKALGEGRKRRFPLGELTRLKFQRIPLGVRVGQGRKVRFQLGEGLFHTAQLLLGAAGLGLMQLSVRPGGVLLPAELVQRVPRGQLRLSPLELGRQGVQLGGVSGVAGGFGAGSVPAGEKSRQLSLFGRQLAAESVGLFGPPKGLL